MVDIRLVCHFMLEWMLPRAHSVAQFDTLPIDAIARHTRRTVLVPHADTIAPLSYQAPIIREAIHAVKFYQHARTAELLGEAAAGCVAEELAERRMFGDFFDPIIVPIPLHRSRMRERGFNQAERIAQALAKHVADTPLTVVPDILVRTRKTHSQTRLSRTARLDNMWGAFEVPDTSRVERLSIILVDDVVTTGATMKAARDALLEAGAHDVLCVAVAH